MAVEKIRGVGSFSLTGIKAFECLSDYEATVQLRSLTEAGVDQGAHNLAPYDLNSLPTAGGGFLFQVFDQPGGTLLVSGAAAMRGVRAAGVLSGTPAATNTVTITYPDRSNQLSATITTISRTYTFVAATAVPAQYEVQVGGSAAASWLNLVEAINGTADYGSAIVGHGTLPCYELTAREDTGTLVVEARDGGTWGNAARISGTGAITPSSATALSGGTGNAGLILTVEGELLLDSLVPDPDTSRNVHAEVYGLKSAGADPLKLLTGPGQINASTMTLP